VPAARANEARWSTFFGYGLPLKPPVIQNPKQSLFRHAILETATPDGI
jgi:hypothetical protein